MEKRCTRCEHATMDDPWGDIKCDKRFITIKYPVKPRDCKDYKLGVPKLSQKWKKKGGGEEV